MIKSEIWRGFASDNNAGVHPDILKELSDVNQGHAIGYGADIYTEEAKDLFKKHLGTGTDVYFVFTGTAANVLGITALTRSWNSILTASTAHIEQDECGAPEKFSGCKVLTVDGFGFEHHAQPGVISITQATEMGTVYSTAEIKELADFAHDNGMYLHMDGARISNAAVSLNLPFKAFTTDAGVDILSFGGTKNGMMFGEAICFLKPGLSENFKFLQGMQLASKMRFISAQYIAFFRNDLWKKSASHSNAMAQMLFNEIKDISDITVTQKVESNGVFVIIPQRIVESLQNHYFFYPWDESRSEYRWMTSWDTTEDDISNFVSILRKFLKGL